MNVSCPSCGTIYRVDPRRVPTAGVLAQCARCPQVIAIALAVESMPLGASGASAVSAIAAGTTAGAQAFEPAPAGPTTSTREPATLETMPETASSTSVEEPSGEAAPAEKFGGSTTAEAAGVPSDYRESDERSADSHAAAGESQTEPPSFSAEASSGESAPAATIPEAEEASESAPLPLLEPSGDAGAGVSLPPPPFGSSDPQQRARRLARALVSDIAVYHPDRKARAVQQGTLRSEFREEIRKSWEEYEAQVGNQIARETSYFRDALNEILAEGGNVF